MASEILTDFHERLRWWYAEWRGSHPQCGTCDSLATLYLSPEGYRCQMCYARGQLYSGIGYVRDLKPEDHFDAE